MDSRALIPIAGIVVIAVAIFLLAPSVSIQNGGSATLIALNGGSIKGTATLTPFNGGQDTIVEVDLQQLAARSVYAAAVRTGSCYGGLVAQLISVSTDSSGSGSSSTTVSASVSQEWFIVVYNGPSLGDGVLACGRVVIRSVPESSSTVVPNTPIIINPSETLPPATTPQTPGQFPNTGGGPPK